MENRSALIAGATGLIGSCLLEKLCEDSYYDSVCVLTRRPTGYQHSKIQEVIIDFTALNKIGIPSVRDVFCCLGTTMKKSGSKEAFRKIDYDYPLALATLTHQKGAQQFLLVSSMGANKKSFFFYNQIKGELEEAIVKVGFPTLHLMRPSILLGNRKENRLGEKVGQALMQGASPLMLGPLEKYRPIAHNIVSQVMLNLAKKELKGSYIFDSDKIKTLALMK